LIICYTKVSYFRIFFKIAQKRLDKRCIIVYTTKVMEIDIKAIRKKLGLTQEALAKKLGVTRMTVYNWETKKKKPSNLAKRQLSRLEVKNGE